MKKIFGFYMVGLLWGLAAFALPCTRADYDFAQEAVAKARRSEMFSGFEMTKLELSAMETARCSGDLSVEDFCASADTKLQLILNAHSRGPSTVGGLSELRDTLALTQRIRTLCPPSS